MARVVILSRTSKWGLAKDAKWVEQVLREAHATRALTIASIDHMDPIEFVNPKPVDLQIHLEVPCRLAWPWAKHNIVVVNPEWWPQTAWNWALAAADRVIFKSPHVATLFPEVATIVESGDKSRRFQSLAALPSLKHDITHGSPTANAVGDSHNLSSFSSLVAAEKAVVIPWRSPPIANTTNKKQNKFLAVVGASVNKTRAMRIVVGAWKSEWPPLEIWCTPESAAELKPLAEANSNISWVTEYRSEKELQAAQQAAKFHCVASVAEGFGHTMAECAAVESLPLWCALPVQEKQWQLTVGKIATSNPQPNKFREGPREITTEAVQEAVESLLALTDAEYAEKAETLRRIAFHWTASWRGSWKDLLKPMFRGMSKREQPLVLRRLKPEELPRVGIVTLTRNRPKWWTNMAQNILKTDYPTDKLVWVIVDDSESTQRVDEQVLKFQQSAPSIRLEYISLAKPLTVGEKRNRGCAAAVAAGAEVLMMMDDDDHYPKSSVEARITYMKLLKRDCVYCSRLPMYDCTRYISAMNVPPLDLAPAERVSEATLAFTRGFWEERPFPAVSVAEGEGFVGSEGKREASTAEIAPEGIIVSFLHGKNSTARHVPKTEEANGCHYGFSDEFFMYLCERGEA